MNLQDAKQELIELRQNPKYPELKSKFRSILRCVEKLESKLIEIQLQKIPVSKPRQY